MKVTAFHLFFLVCCFIATDLIWRFAGVELGLFLTVCAGIVLGGLGYFFLMVCFGVVLEWFIPTVPSCACGKKLQRKFIGEGYRVLGCKCGATYVDSDGLIARIGSDGEQHPFLESVGHLNWRSTNDESHTINLTDEIRQKAK